jgi:hypothetical protein
MVPNAIDSSASVFTSLWAANCLIAHCGGNSWSLTPPIHLSPPLASTDSLQTHSQSQLLTNDNSQSQSYVTTDSQVLVSSIFLGTMARFYYCQTVAGLLMWGTLSDERTGLSFTIAAASHQCSLRYNL